MRKLKILFTAAALLCGTSAAFAADFEIINASKTTIYHFYVSAAGKDDWGEDQLGDDDEDALNPSDSFTVKDIAAGIYDLKIVGGDDTVCIARHVAFGKTGQTVTLSDKMLEGCAN